VLYWDKFSRPVITPRSGTSIDYWWFDDARAARLESARQSQPKNEQEQTGNHFSVVTVLGTLIIAGVGGFMLLRRRRTGKTPR